MKASTPARPTARLALQGCLWGFLTSTAREVTGTAASITAGRCQSPRKVLGIGRWASSTAPWTTCAPRTTPSSTSSSRPRCRSSQRWTSTASASTPRASARTPRGSGGARPWTRPPSAWGRRTSARGGSCGARRSGRRRTWGGGRTYRSTSMTGMILAKSLSTQKLRSSMASSITTTTTGWSRSSGRITSISRTWSSTFSSGRRPWATTSSGRPSRSMAQTRCHGIRCGTSAAATTSIACLSFPWVMRGCAFAMLGCTHGLASRSPTKATSRLSQPLARALRIGVASSWPPLWPGRRCQHREAQTGSSETLRVRTISIPPATTTGSTDECSMCATSGGIAPSRAWAMARMAPGFRNASNA
mmetsp:Transcript_84852/g.220972  ORF Transcript_84852/g.220972 Transcript_84852/m.220972 type:complete len:360 (+) Transcript_84852:913-1992(+)